MATRESQRLRQILINLAGNAVKFTRIGGVTVNLQPSETRGDAENHWLEVQVIDTGIGMSGKQMDNVLNAFAQGDDSTTRKFGGTGLGLSIAKRLIEIMGGELKVCSVLEEGSNFTFYLPMRTQADAVLLNAKIDYRVDKIPTAQQDTNQIRFSGEHVLFAEDNEINQLVAREELKNMGLNVEVVENGKQAVEAWQQGHFDLILMDVQMPDKDGLEATRRIRELEKGSTQAIPIVALTANAMKEDFQRCLDAGMNDYLTKPFAPQKLAFTLKRCLKGRHEER